MYGKLYSSIYQGTLRGRPDELLVFTNMIATCDRRGVVDKHPRAISEEVGLSLERVQAAIAVLESPDPESRSPQLEGRRIVRLDVHRSWGWQIVNHAHYQSIRNEEERAEKNRKYQADYRDRVRSVSTRKEVSAPVSTGEHPSAHVDVDVDVDADVDATSRLNSTLGYRGGVGVGEVAPNGAVAPVRVRGQREKTVAMNPPTREEVNLHATKIGLPDHEVEKFLSYYTSNGWKVGPNPMKNWQAAMVGWKTRWEQDGARGMKAVQRELTDADHAKGF